MKVKSPLRGLSPRFVEAICERSPSKFFSGEGLLDELLSVQDDSGSWSEVESNNVAIFVPELLHPRENVKSKPEDVPHEGQWEPGTRRERIRESLLVEPEQAEADRGQDDERQHGARDLCRTRSKASKHEAFFALK